MSNWIDHNWCIYCTSLQLVANTLCASSDDTITVNDPKGITCSATSSVFAMYSLGMLMLAVSAGSCSGCCCSGRV